MELTGITDEMLDSAPGIEDVTFGELEEFCAGSASFGAPDFLFDYSFLKRAMINGNRMFERNGVDTLMLCRKFMPAGESKNLSAACPLF